jgi:transposase-like protein
MSLGHIVNQLLGETPVLPHRAGRVHTSETHVLGYPQRVKQCVQESDESVIKLAEMYGVSTSTISRWRQEPGAAKFHTTYSDEFKRAAAKEPGSSYVAAAIHGVSAVSIRKCRKQYS